MITAAKLLAACMDAADAIDAKDKRIFELEAKIVQLGEIVQNEFEIKQAQARLRQLSTDNFQDAYTINRCQRMRSPANAWNAAVLFSEQLKETSDHSRRYKR